VVEVWWHGRVGRSSGIRRLSRVMGEFPADNIFNTCGEVVDPVKALEHPMAGYRAGLEQRVRRLRRLEKENAV
jgi:hypothetical protein